MSLGDVDEIKQLARELDERCARLHDTLDEERGDARDHLRQIHFRLTEIKGHLGAVRHDLKRD